MLKSCENYQCKYKLVEKSLDKLRVTGYNNLCVVDELLYERSDDDRRGVTRTFSASWMVSIDD